MTTNEDIFANVKAIRTKEFNQSNQLSLGELILKLEPMLKKTGRSEDEPNVVFDFEYLFPISLDSWRGSYEELAIGFEIDSSKDRSPMSLVAFHELLTSAIGGTYQGYKGGQFVMHKNTPVWVANYGNSGNTGVFDVVDKGYEIVIITGLCEF